MTAESSGSTDRISFQVASLIVLPTRRTDGPYKAAAEFVHYRIKNPKEPAILGTITRLVERGGPVLDLITEVDLAIPVPGSQRLRESAENSQWPSLIIAEQLQIAGIAARVSPYLQRTETVPRSRSLRTEGRVPVSRHLETIKFAGSFSLEDTAARKILLVDDVLTKGTTLAACYQRVRQAAPDADIIGFTIARTDNDTPLTEPADMFAPKLETITYWPGDTTARRSSSR